MIDAAPPARRPGLLLVTAIVAIPGLFCWLVLRRGFARSFRVAVFTYAGSMAVVGLLARFS